MILVLRLSLRRKGKGYVIVCICRAVSEKEVARAIDKGASTLRDLQRCGIGDQCGSCHNALRGVLARAAAASAAPQQPAPACACGEATAAV